jgi:putative endonuclease
VFFKSKITNNAVTSADKSGVASDPNVGAQAEQAAEHFLHKQGLKTVAKNYRCKLGEIDLIMAQHDELIFVEVRLRRHSQFANAAESVTITKQHKIIKAAQYYLQEHQLTDKINCRFDVIAFGKNNEPEWIKNAFTL